MRQAFMLDPRRLAFSKTLAKPAGIALLLMPFTFQPVCAALEGTVESVSCDGVKGWAYDNAAPSSRINVNVYKVIQQKSILLAALTADTYRQDLFDNGKGDGKVGFAFRLPASVRNAATLSLSVRYAGTTTDLAHSPQTTASACYGRLNDTGWQTCANDTDYEQACSEFGFQGQDGDYGRDAKSRMKKLAKTGGGQAGFDFTKIANNGSQLPATALLGKASKDWACTLDNVTGLLWEVKTDDDGLRDKDNRYSWYNPDNATNGGHPGKQGGGNCTGGIACDTDGYAKGVNALKLCGKTDWRVPNREELSSIIDYSLNLVSPFPAPVDKDYFPNTALSLSVWSSLSFANDSAYAWYLDNGSWGAERRTVKSSSQAVWLVSGRH